MKKKRLIKLARKAHNIEEPLRNVRCVTLLMRLYQDHRDEAPETWEERNEDLMQFNYLCDRLVEEVRALETAFYGSGSVVPLTAQECDAA